MLRLVFRNLFRHKSRTGLTLGAIIFGVIGLILSGGFIEDIFNQLREATIHSQLGHIQVFKSGYLTTGRRNPFQYLISDGDALVEGMRALPYVSDVMVRLNFYGLINNGHANLPIIGEGVEPEKEKRLGSAFSVIAGRPMVAEDSYGIMVGHGVARALKIKPGDYITLLANTADEALNSLEFEVIGIFQTISRDYDNYAVRIHLAAAKELLDTTGVHSLVFSLEDTQATEVVARELKNRLPVNEFDVKTWEELADFYKKTVDLYRRQFGVMQIIILVLVLLTVANSVNMAVYERSGEFGTMMALGDRRSDIFRQIIKENMLLGLIGAIIGVLIGMALGWLITWVGIAMPPLPNSDVGYTAYIRLVPGDVIMAFGVGVIATISAALLPAYRVSRLPVAEALRENV